MNKRLWIPLRITSFNNDIWFWNSTHFNKFVFCIQNLDFEFWYRKINPLRCFQKDVNAERGLEFACLCLSLGIKLATNCKRDYRGLYFDCFVYFHNYRDKCKRHNISCNMPCNTKKQFYQIKKNAQQSIPH